MLPPSKSIVKANKKAVTQAHLHNARCYSFYIALILPRQLPVPEPPQQLPEA